MAKTKLHDWQKDIIKSGLNWEVNKEDILDTRGNALPVQGTFRSDNNNFLGIVSENYAVIQNEELFRLPELLVKAGTDVQLDRAGEVDGGKLVHCRYALPKYRIDVMNVGDIMNTFLIASTKHDGKGSITFKAGVERLVCTNGMTSMANHHLSSIRHTKGAFAKLPEMRKLVAMVGRELEDFAELADIFANVKLSMKDIREVLEDFFHTSEKSNLENSTRKQNQARAVLAIFESNDGDTFKKQRGTAWNLYNAFTNYADHNMNYRPSRNESEEQARTRGAMFGAGEVFKFYALQAVANMVRKNHSLVIPETFGA